MNNPIESRISHPRFAKIAATVSDHRPLLGSVIDMHGAASLSEYARTLRSKESGDPLQPHSEVTDAVVTEAQRTLGRLEGGNTIIEKLKRQVDRTHVLLTGNHHGPNIAAILHQSTEIFGFAVDHDSIVPVLAGGTVHLDSQLTRPSSILLADGSRKVNVFTGKKHKERMITAAPAFDTRMVDRAKKTVRGQRGYEYSPKEADAVSAILDQSYMPTAESEPDNFSDQSVLLNRLLWQQVHSDELTGKVPDIAFLELEGVANQLLFTDLHNRDTITYQALFDREFRNTILKNLDRVTGCWNDTITQGEGDNEVVQQKQNSKGTTLFWGINSDGSRYSFHYEEEYSKGFLVGTKKDGSTSKIELTEEKGPSELIARLERTSDDRIVPSMFTAFLEIAFAHGFTCVGGPKQIEYLTDMKQKLVASLLQTGRVKWAEKVAKVPTESYLSGVATTYATYPDGSVQPAGIVEVVANNGYTEEDLWKMQTMTVEDSVLPAWVKLRTDLPEKQRAKVDAAYHKAIFHYLGDKSVEKGM